MDLLLEAKELSVGRKFNQSDRITLKILKCPATCDRRPIYNRGKPYQTHSFIERQHLEQIKVFESGCGGGHYSGPIAFPGLESVFPNDKGNSSFLIAASPSLFITDNHRLGKEEEWASGVEVVIGPILESDRSGSREEKWGIFHLGEPESVRGKPQKVRRTIVIAQDVVWNTFVFSSTPSYFYEDPEDAIRLDVTSFAPPLQSKKFNSPNRK
ncbi:hypothetical protein NPIL_95231 [Nephila pilipes]|uniref:Uncharacterized protein n=1 Tax=Nephila pilipes TaxID=299642 RepID=A0A8X6TVJ6_NEPPI|nr:hypothetical protein NPIL_95231 [Nephila pilipes]